MPTRRHCGANAYGFGTTTGTGNRLQIGGTTVVQAHDSSNSGFNVSRNQSQTNIINNIISSIEATSPGDNYTVTSTGTGNSRTFTVTADSVGTADNRNMTGDGQFASNGNIAGGTDISGSTSGHSITMGQIPTLLQLPQTHLIDQLILQIEQMNMCGAT